MSGDRLKPLRVAIIGTGYVGLTTAMALAYLGHFEQPTREGYRQGGRKAREPSLPPGTRHRGRDGGKGPLHKD